MDIIDLEHDFFLIKFDLKTDLDDVLKRGPWFVGQHFISIRQWELEFKKPQRLRVHQSQYGYDYLSSLLGSMIPPSLRKLEAPLGLCFG